MLVRTARQAGREEGGRGRGQALVEFALIIPILMIVFMGLIEVALAYNAMVGVNRASQDGASMAAIIGKQDGADCLVLKTIEDRIYAPNDPKKIIEVVIERARPAGGTILVDDDGDVDTPPVLARNTYGRLVGTERCMLPDGTPADLHFPVTPTPHAYDDMQRCNALLGCFPPHYDDSHSTVDNIAVSIKYRHIWATPLNAAFEFFGGGNTGWTIEQRNIFRVEPVL